MPNDFLEVLVHCIACKLMISVTNKTFSCKTGLENRDDILLQSNTYQPGVVLALNFQ